MFDVALAQLLDLVREHGTIILFAAAFLENAAFMSWLVPGEKLVAVGGYFVQRGELRFEQAWLAVFLGVLCGDHIAYLIGRFAGQRVLRRLPYAHLIARAERLIRRHGGWAVLFGRFTGIFRPIMLFTVGMTGCSYRRFWLFELVGAASWSVVWLGVGMLGSEAIDHLGELGGLGAWVPWAVLGAIVAIAALAWRFRDRAKHLILGDDDSTERPEPAGRAPQPVS